MTISQAIILGLIQGLGEFLPISSLGHLALAPWLFGFPDPGLSFDVALHFGTLLAVLFYFRKDWIDIVKYSFQYLLTPKREPPSANYHLLASNYRLLITLIIATIPGAIFGFYLENAAENYLRHPLLISGALLIGGLFLYVADKKSISKNSPPVTFRQSFLIGLSQAIAIIPGISRSGATITAGLFLGLDRVSAARFSFLLSAPIIFGAMIFKLDDFFQQGIGALEIAGVFASTLSGFLAIKLLLSLVEKLSYKIFFWYRAVLASLILILFFWRG